jgi:AcrR family transcriptional regulator
MVEVNDNASNHLGLRGHRVRNVTKAEERRRDILLGATRAFARKGYLLASIEDIASEAGLTKGHIYHYFLSKEHIFTEIRVTAIQSAVEELEEVLETTADPEKALRESLRRQTAGVFGPIEKFAAALTDPPDLSPENKARIREVQRRYEGMVQENVSAGQRQGVFSDGDPKVMMFTLMCGALGVAIWYNTDGEWQPDWIVDQVTDQLMRSVLRSC